MRKSPTVSPTELLVKRLLDQYFGGLQKIDNYRPQWLGGLEIDRYYPEIKIGIEFQGLQHYRPVKGLQRSRSDFFDQLQKDRSKINIAAKKGVKIVPLGLHDLTEARRIKYNFKQIADLGLKNAQKEGRQRAIRVLKAIRWDRDPDPKFVEQFERIKRGKKWRVRNPQRHRKGLLQRILAAASKKRSSRLA
jgi:hypothetical protein